MFSRHVQGGQTWIDAVNPTAEEIHDLMEECNIPPDLMQDMTTMSPRTETIARKDALKIVLDFPIVKRTDISHPHEVKFIATKNYLITVRFEDIEALHRYSKQFEVQSVLVKKAGKTTGGHLLISMLRYLYEALDKKVDYLESRIVDIEQEIFAEREKEMVFEISKIARRVINFRQVLRTHESALKDLEKALEFTFGKTYAPYAQLLLAHHEHLTHRIQSLSSTLTELRETNFGILTTKQNEIMKILTIMAFITFPLTLFTSTFGMNTENTPLVGSQYDFWTIISVMLVVSIIFFGFFRYKKWM